MTQYSTQTVMTSPDATMVTGTHSRPPTAPTTVGGTGLSAEPRSESHTARSHGGASRGNATITALLDHSCVIRRAAAALVVACIAVVAAAGLAIAHGDLVESDPADGATLTTTPYTLTATFAEDIDPEASTLIVENASGVEVVRGAIVFDDPTSMVAQLPALPDGVYTVRWTTVTPDDAGIERGTYTFTVAATTASATPSASSGPIVPAPSEPGNNDIILALVLAGIAIGAVVLFVFFRGRR